MKRIYPLVAHLIGLFVFVSQTSAEQWELVPFGGARVGGQQSLSNSSYTDLKFDSGAAYGLSLGYRVSDEGELDVVWSRQNTRVVASGPGVPDITTSNAGIDHFRLDGLYLPGSGPWRPFLLAGIGATYFEPVNQFNGAIRFNAALGTGVKYYFSKRWGLRFDARWVPTVVSSDSSLYCTGGGSGAQCSATSTGQMLSQFEFTTGVILRWGPTLVEAGYDDE